MERFIVLADFIDQTAFYPCTVNYGRLDTQYLDETLIQADQSTLIVIRTAIIEAVVTMCFWIGWNRVFVACTRESVCCIWGVEVRCSRICGAPIAFSDSLHCSTILSDIQSTSLLQYHHTGGSDGS